MKFEKTKISFFPKSTRMLCTEFQDSSSKIVPGSFRTYGHTYGHTYIRTKGNFNILYKLWRKIKPFFIPQSNVTKKILISAQIHNTKVFVNYQNFIKFLKFDISEKKFHSIFKISLTNSKKKIENNRFLII